MKKRFALGFVTGALSMIGLSFVINYFVAKDLQKMPIFDMPAPDPSTRVEGIPHPPIKEDFFNDQLEAELRHLGLYRS